MNATQIIFVCDRSEIADNSNSETPAWPVQDQSGRWNYEQFPGQRVTFKGDRVEFGFLANQMPAEEVAGLDMDDLPSDVYIVGRDFYRAA